ncbi:MAG: DegT/DnrJ/EryC1/StrS family aminotransferase [Sedimenticola sp.]
MTPLVFHPIAVDGKKYPKPVFSMLPGLSENYWRLSRGDTFKSSFLKDGLFFQNGRYAIHYALKKAGVKRGSTILLPSYHCRSLVEPAMYLDSDIRFYPIKRDLTIDLDSVSIIVEESSKPIEVMLVVHYFGFPQDIESITSFCTDNNIVLIEDCAHSFYGTVGGKLMGTFGDYSIASPKKFFPMSEGGVLIDNVNTIAPNSLNAQPLLEEAKHLAKYLSSMVRKKCENLPDTKITNEIKGHFIKGDSPRLSEKYLYFREESINLSGCMVSRFLMHHANHERIIKMRRDNYQRWLDGIAGIQACEPLQARLKDEIVPYVFPLVLTQQSEEVFHELKCWGIPIWRWEDLAVTDCRYSNEYRLSLIQLPCHQDISTDQIDWMIDRVGRSISNVLEKNSESSS